MDKHCSPRFDVRWTVNVMLMTLLCMNGQTLLTQVWRQVDSERHVDDTTVYEWTNIAHPGLTSGGQWTSCWWHNCVCMDKHCSPRFDVRWTVNVMLMTQLCMHGQTLLTQVWRQVDSERHVDDITVYAWTNIAHPGLTSGGQWTSCWWHYCVCMDKHCSPRFDVRWTVNVMLMT